VDSIGALFGFKSQFNQRQNPNESPQRPLPTACKLPLVDICHLLGHLRHFYSHPLDLRWARASSPLVHAYLHSRLSFRLELAGLSDSSNNKPSNHGWAFSSQATASRTPTCRSPIDGNSGGNRGRKPWTGRNVSAFQGKCPSRINAVFRMPYLALYSPLLLFELTHSSQAT
jgi:hypothetical protein